MNIDNLIKKILSYNPNADIEIIRLAYTLSGDAHCGQKRMEGTPYIYHSLSVADILADIRLDTVTIAAGLLHDTVEDTGIVKKDIRDMFGTEVTFLVEAVTKISKIEFKSHEDTQAENFRKMFLAMSEDVRVILLKFADRLHNMRTIEYLPKDKQERIAQETLAIYAPIANRLGIAWIRAEFEDLTFKTLEPEIYRELYEKVEKYREEFQTYIDEIKNTLLWKFEDAGIQATINGRVKNLYGIYQKMQRQKILFEQIYDIIGLRIVTDTIDHCYSILGIINSFWTHVPGRFKDFISAPKSNMYQSIHTTVIVEGRLVEFQIRTMDMNNIAEEGIAAHWMYKQYKEKDETGSKDDKFIKWLRELIKEYSEIKSDSREFLRSVQGEVVLDTIQVLTPKGEIRELPVGSTPIDFAYNIHSQVGNRCSGARVNGSIVRLSHKLKSGDMVEIMTSNTQTPSKDWLELVVTERAKSRIKQWIREEEKNRAVKIGEKLIKEEMRRHNVPLSLLKSEKMQKIMKSFSIQNMEDFYVLIGYGKISAHQISNKFSSDKHEKLEEYPESPKSVKPVKDREGAIRITGIDDVLYHIGKCCLPIHGDKIIGFVTKGKGITIHREECPNLEKLSEDKNKFIDVEWAMDKEIISKAKIIIEIDDRKGIISDISSYISSMDINIVYMEAKSTKENRAIIELIVEVKDKSQLVNIMNKISRINGVFDLKR